MTAYPDTPAGWLNASRDKWVAEMRFRGHDVTWRKAGRVSMRNRDSTHYRITCRNCGAGMNAGEYWSEALPGDPGFMRAGRVLFCPATGHPRKSGRRR